MFHHDVVRVVVSRLAPLLHSGLLAVLEADACIQVIAAELSYPALEEVLAASRPDVVILDDRIEHALLVRLKQYRSPPAVLVFTHERQPALYRTMLLAEGVVCLAPTASPGEIATTVHAAAQTQGVPPVHPRDEHLPATERLTDREYQVAWLVSEGYSNAEIAMEMGIADSTVKTHSARIRSKLGKTRRELRGIRLTPPLLKG